jgi:hypothetical protein
LRPYAEGSQATHPKWGFDGNRARDRAASPADDADELAAAELAFLSVHRRPSFDRTPLALRPRPDDEEGNRPCALCST